MKASIGFVLGALCVGALGIAVPPLESTLAREAIIVHVGDTLTPKYFVQTDTVLGVGPGIIVPKKCGIGRAFLRLYKGATALSGDTVIVNVTPPCKTETPIPPTQQPIDADSVFVSSSRTWVNGVGPAVPVATPYNPGWTATIPGAQWIWRTAVVANPAAVEVDTFTRRFTLTTPSPLALDVASDNGFKALLNGTVLADRLLDGTGTFAVASHYPIQPSALLMAGINTLTIIVRNGATIGATVPSQNPAGLLYRLSPTQQLVPPTDSGALGFYPKPGGGWCAGVVSDTTVHVQFCATPSESWLMFLRVWTGLAPVNPATGVGPIDHCETGSLDPSGMFHRFDCAETTRMKGYTNIFAHVLP